VLRSYTDTVIAVFLVIISYMEKHFTFFFNMMVLLTSFFVIASDYGDRKPPPLGFE